MTEIDLQTEVDRKALDAILQAAELIEEGELTRPLADRLLNILQTAFNGITSKEVDTLGMLTELSEYNRQTPQWPTIYLRRYANAKGQVTLTLSVIDTAFAMKIAGTTPSAVSKEFDTHAEAMRFAGLKHKQVVERGYIPQD